MSFTVKLILLFNLNITNSSRLLVAVEEGMIKTHCAEVTCQEIQYLTIQAVGNC